MKTQLILDNNKAGERGGIGGMGDRQIMTNDKKAG